MKARLLRRILDPDRERHGDDRRDPRRPELVDRHPPQVNHETEHARKRAALRRAKPRCVDLDESRRPKRLRVTIDPAQHDEQPEHPHERRRAEREIADYRARRADQQRLLPTQQVGEQPVHHVSNRIRVEKRRENIAHVLLREMKLIRHRLVRDGDVVAAHVAARVEQPHDAPIQPTPRAIPGRQDQTRCFLFSNGRGRRSHGVGGGCNSNGIRCTENHPSPQISGAAPA